MSVRSDNALAGDLSFPEAANDALSVHETIRRYHDSLIRFLRQRLRVKEDAADVAQEAYVRDGLELASDQPTADREIAAEQDLELLYDAIEHLPPKCRNVFLLSRVQRLTYPQIAAHCSISVKMVEKHISHALAICMKKVGGGSDHTS